MPPGVGRLQAAYILLNWVSLETGVRAHAHMSRSVTVCSRPYRLLALHRRRIDLLGRICDNGGVAPYGQYPGLRETVQEISVPSYRPRGKGSKYHTRILQGSIPNSPWQ
jgi:hypothetical protein